MVLVACMEEEELVLGLPQMVVVLLDTEQGVAVHVLKLGQLQTKCYNQNYEKIEMATS